MKVSKGSRSRVQPINSSSSEEDMFPNDDQHLVDIAAEVAHSAARGLLDNSMIETELKAQYGDENVASVSHAVDVRIENEMQFPNFDIIFHELNKLDSSVELLAVKSQLLKIKQSVIDHGVFPIPHGGSTGVSKRNETPVSDVVVSGSSNVLHAVVDPVTNILMTQQQASDTMQNPQQMSKVMIYDQDGNQSFVSYQPDTTFVVDSTVQGGYYLAPVGGTQRYTFGVADLQSALRSNENVMKNKSIVPNASFGQSNAVVTDTNQSIGNPVTVTVTNKSTDLPVQSNIVTDNNGNVLNPESVLKEEKTVDKHDITKKSTDENTVMKEAKDTDHMKEASESETKPEIQKKEEEKEHSDIDKKLNEKDSNEHSEKEEEKKEEDSGDEKSVDSRPPVSKRAKEEESGSVASDTHKNTDSISKKDEHSEKEEEKKEDSGDEKSVDLKPPVSKSAKEEESGSVASDTHKKVNTDSISKKHSEKEEVCDTKEVSKSGKKKVLKHGVPKKEAATSEKSDTETENSGVRERFVNYFDKCRPPNVMHAKILSLFEMCRIFLGINRDVAYAITSYSKIRASFTKFQPTGTLREGHLHVSKIDDEDEVTILVEFKTDEFYRKRDPVFIPDSPRSSVESAEKRSKKHSTSTKKKAEKTRKSKKLVQKNTISWQNFDAKTLKSLGKKLAEHKTGYEFGSKYNFQEFFFEREWDSIIKRSLEISSPRYSELVPFSPSTIAEEDAEGESTEEYEDDEK